MKRCYFGRDPFIDKLVKFYKHISIGLRESMPIRYCDMASGAKGRNGGLWFKTAAAIIRTRVMIGVHLALVYRRRVDFKSF